MQLIFDLMGAQFRPQSAKDALREAAPGDALTLITDGNNEYDSFAIEVHLGDEHIGFLPRGNRELFELLSDGAEPTAEIIAFPSAFKPTIAVQL